MPTQEFQIESAGGPISLVVPSEVMSPSPYSEFMARYMPRMDGFVLADLGCGSGIQGIAALKQGASFVYFLDSNPRALDTALTNAYANGFDSQVEIMDSGNMFETMGDIKVDGIICNPASLPMHTSDQLYSPYFAGEDGRQMISQMIVDGKKHLNRGGGLLFVQTSLADLSKSQIELWGNGFVHEVLAITSFPFRDFYNQAWIDEIAKKTSSRDRRYSAYDLGLYHADNAVPYEILYLMGGALYPYECRFVEDGPYLRPHVTILPNFLNNRTGAPFEIDL